MKKRNFLLYLSIYLSMRCESTHGANDRDPD